jgi:hypothetical protein
MPFVALSGRGISTIGVLKVLQACGLVNHDRAAVVCYQRREIFVNGECMHDRKATLNVNDRYTLEIRPKSGAAIRKMDVIPVEYPYHGYIRRHQG